VRSAPWSASDGSSVWLPFLSHAMSFGILRPAVFASRRPNHANAAVAWSISIRPRDVGTAQQIGLVPKIGCFAPCGATYSGDVAMMMPTSPASASIDA